MKSPISLIRITKLDPSFSAKNRFLEDLLAGICIVPMSLRMIICKLMRDFLIASFHGTDIMEGTIGGALKGQVLPTM